MLTPDADATRRSLDSSKDILKGDLKYCGCDLIDESLSAIQNPDKAPTQRLFEVFSSERQLLTPFRLIESTKLIPLNCF